jgi:toxin ParE1/3/4
MSAEESPRTVRLTETAEADFQNIIVWTLGEFGLGQADIYADTLISAITALVDGPTIVGVRERREIGKGLCTLHVARGDRKGRHLVLFRVKSRAHQVEILRLLHDAMDLKLHTPQM